MAILVDGFKIAIVGDARQVVSWDRFSDEIFIAPIGFGSCGMAVLPANMKWYC